MLLVCKSCSRKKPSPTIAYVAITIGQRNRITKQTAATIEIGRRAEEGRGEKSARIIPNPAIPAKPTNGWRGKFNKFIVPRFSFIPQRQRKLFEQSRRRDANVDGLAQATRDARYV